MKTMEQIRQWTLSQEQLGWLLNFISADKVVGVDNDALFASSKTIGASNIQAGLEQLIEQGWVVKEDRKYNFSSQLIFLVSIIANPEVTMLLKQEIGHGHRAVTYYFANQIIVEQIRTNDDQYMLSAIASVEDLLERISIYLPLEMNSENDSIVIPYLKFRDAIQQAKNGDLNLLDEILSKKLDKKQVEQSIKLLNESKPKISIGWGVFINKKLLAEMNLFVFFNANSPFLQINTHLNQDNISLIASDRISGNEITKIINQSFAYRDNQLAKSVRNGAS